VNPATTRTRTAAQRQAVLGLVVDAAPIDAAFGARLRTTAARMDWPRGWTGAPDPTGWGMTGRAPLPEAGTRSARERTAASPAGGRRRP
jgi:hypothetical protein